MAKEREPHISRREKRAARRNAILRMIIYDGEHDTSSRAIAERLKKGRPELGITTRMVTYFRRKHQARIHGTPRK